MTNVMNKKTYIVIGIMAFITLGMKASLLNDIIGVYEKEFDGYDVFSILSLYEDHRFTHSSRVGACITEVEGEWDVKDDSLVIFRVDSIYTDDYRSRMVMEHLKKAEGAFKIDKDTFLYKTNVDIATMLPCFPEIKEARYNKKSKSIIFESDVDCSCVSIKGKHLKVE